MSANQIKPASLGFTDAVRASVQSYVELHKKEWDTELETTNKVSKFIRHTESKQKFSIEYWNDGVCLAYPKAILSDRGGWKNICYAVDVNNEKIYARAKPKAKTEEERDVVKEKSENESRITALFQGCRGVVQNVRNSCYPSKDGSIEKFHDILELYDGAFRDLKSIDLIDQERKIVVLDLMRGLASIHAKGYAHGDLLGRNILYKLTGNQVIKCILCDLGEAKDEENVPKNLYSLVELQQIEAKRLIDLLKEFYISQRKTNTEVFDQLSTLSKKEKVSAADALTTLENYYKSLE